MQRTRWTAVALVIPTIAAVAVACDQRTPTEVERLSARQAAASLDHGRDERRLRAEPWVFVGTVENCGVPGSPIVTSAWLNGMGLPDGGDDDLNTPLNQSNRRGLLLNKNGSTGNCASAGADIRGVRRMEIDATFTLGFDYRNGGHCGAGAPRFNVVVEGSEPEIARRFFFACAHGVQTPAPQDPTEWTRVRISAAAAGAPLGRRVESIEIVQDEGTEVVTPQPPSLNTGGIGLAVLDNIYINGRYIRRGRGIAEPRGRRGEDRDEN
jgi:hypothetical protein